MHVYGKLQVPGYQRPNRFTRNAMDVAASKDGVPCSIADVAPAVIRLQSCANAMPAAWTPTCFLEVLREWGCTWMWEKLKLTGDSSWVGAAIERRTLLAVTNESYITYEH